MTLVERILAIGSRRDRSLMLWGHEPVDYGTLVGQARRKAGGLLARGLDPGQVVAVVASTSLEVVASLLGVWLAGGVVACLPPPPRMGRRSQWRADLERKVASCGARWVVGSGFLAPEDLDGPEQVVSSVPELALVQFSSGTTREPAAIAITHAALSHHLEAIVGQFPAPSDGHTCVSWLPLFHDMGLVGALLSSLAGQANLVLMRPEQFLLRPETWLRAITETRATTSPAPNFALALCAERCRSLEGLDLSGWRHALVGAEQVLPSTLDRFVGRFARVGFRREALTPVYGLAEATLAVTMSDFASPPSVRGFDPLALAEGRVEPGQRLMVSVGRPLPGVELRIDGSQVGTVMVRGPSLMQGYLGRPERTAEVLRDGWLDTGDVGFVQEGELYLCGRSRDLVILQGRNHDPAAVEESLEPIEGLQAAAAFATSDPERGTEALVVVAELGRAAAPVEELAVQARDAVIGATGLIPARVHLCPAGALARTSSGKIRRQQVRSDLERGLLVPLFSA